MNASDKDRFVRLFANIYMNMKAKDKVRAPSWNGWLVAGQWWLVVVVYFHWLDGLL